MSMIPMLRRASALAFLLFFLSAAVAAIAAEPSIEVKVWVLNFDPFVDGQKTIRLSQRYGWNNPRELAEQYAADVREASGGFIRFKIVGWQDLDEFPVKQDGFVYSVQSYHRAKEDGSWRAPDLCDYPAVIAKHRVAARVDRGECDELWWFGGPGFGFGESAMAGPAAFFINGPTYHPPAVNCAKTFAIMGFNYERGPAEMIHNLSHRTESTMTRIFGGWQADKLEHDWARFAANSHQSRGFSAVGTCHYPPNGESDYDYNNSRYVDSTADDWLNYPLLSGTQSRINCETWGGPDYQRNYLKWWFRHLPRGNGVHPEHGRQNNWWKYVFRFEEYDAQGQPKPRVGVKLQISGDLSPTSPPTAPK